MNYNKVSLKTNFVLKDDFLPPSTFKSDLFKEFKQKMMPLRYHLHTIIMPLNRWM